MTLTKQSGLQADFFRPGQVNFRVELYLGQPLRSSNCITCRCTVILHPNCKMFVARSPKTGPYSTLTMPPYLSIPTDTDTVQRPEHTQPTRTRPTPHRHQIFPPRFNLTIPSCNVLPTCTPSRSQSRLQCNPRPPPLRPDHAS